MLRQLNRLFKAIGGPSNLLRKPATSNYQPTTTDRMTAKPKDLPDFTFMTIRQMLYDPTLRLGLGMRCAPIYATEWAYPEPGDSGKVAWKPGIKANREDVAEFVERQLNKLMMFGCETLLKSQIWGWSGAEVEYEFNEETKLVEFAGLLERRSADVRALEVDGELAGVSFRNVRRDGEKTGEVKLLFPFAIWSNFNAEDGHYYGLSVLHGSYSPWADKWFPDGAMDVRRKFMTRESYRGARLWYPEGSTKTVNENGQEVNTPNGNIARQILENIKAGFIFGGPSTMDPNTGERKWVFEDSEVSGNPAHILQYPHDLDVEELRGIEIPDDVLMSEATGAWAGKAVPMQAFFLGLERFRLNSLIKPFDQQVLRFLVRLNFGPNAFYEVHAKPFIEQYGLNSGETAGFVTDDTRSAPGSPTQQGSANPFFDRGQQFSQAAEFAIGEIVGSSERFTQVVRRALTNGNGSG